MSPKERIQHIPTLVNLNENENVEATLKSLNKVASGSTYNMTSANFTHANVDIGEVLGARFNIASG